MVKKSTAGELADAAQLIALQGLAQLERIIAEGREPTLQEFAQLLALGEIGLKALKASNKLQAADPGKEGQ